MEYAAGLDGFGEEVVLCPNYVNQSVNLEVQMLLGALVLWK